MLRRLTLCAALALAAPAAAQQAASMSADDAYVRSVKYTQDQYGKLSGDNAELKASPALATISANHWHSAKRWARQTA
ncbi:MAG TPA: hypothetical protein VG735_03180 [Caulobacterales bacterium]|nr:hypothetical protein [Caulobacterales bacterium]